MYNDGEREKQADQAVSATPSSGLPSLALWGRFDVFTLSITARGEKRVRGEVEMRGKRGERAREGREGGRAVPAYARGGEMGKSPRRGRPIDF